MAVSFLNKPYNTLPFNTGKPDAPKGLPSIFKEVEGETNFPAHGGVFFTSNEFNFVNTLLDLRETPPIGNTLIGVSGLFNFELFLAREGKGVKYFISIDPDPSYREFWSEAKQAFSDAKTSDEFIRTFTQRLRARYEEFTPKIRRSINTPDVYQDWMDILENNYLPKVFDSAEKYDSVRRLFTEDRFVHFPINLAGDNEHAATLTRRMEENDLIPDTVYISNVENVISESKEDAFENNVSGLSQSETSNPSIVINSVWTEHPSGIDVLTQTSTIGFTSQYID